MKRFTLTVILGIICAFLPVPAAAEVRCEVVLVSRYIWRGFDLNPYKKPVLQPSLDFTLGETGVHVNLWSSFSFEDKAAHEVDLSLTYEFEISDLVSLQAGIIHYGWYFREKFRFQDDTSHEVFLSAGLPGFFLEPSFSFYYDFTNGDGWYALLSVGHSLRFLPGMDPSIHASLGYNGGQWLAEGVDSGLSDLNIGISLPLRFRRLLLTGFVNYTFVLLDAIGREDHFWFGISAAFN